MPHQNRIAALRKQWMLSQDELGFLLGITRHTVGRIELNGGTCKIDTALMLECLFGVPITEIFPQLCAVLHESMAARLADFSLEVNGGSDPASERKRQLLSNFADRAAGNNAGV